ncbi:class D sortase [Alloacidobacterium dinghuense]|uniref:Class D sortase n=1 Tax=Alloacidobacterium dinghuense TaxID=2763107 RepID=A0A7G8BEC6_9BACT|nr:class D sortase [Alloacidobacterium dinghuense]QNI30896.1 class D sortase [Alloacidobacterium dinghuense]
MKKKTLERLLITFGALILFIYALARIHGFVLSRMEIEKFKSQQLLAQELNGGASANKSPDFSLWSEKRIRAYQESLASHFQPAVALLRIPRIHLEVPVLEGTDDLTLNRAVGHIAGTTAPGENGNIGIAGHRDGFFRELKDVVTGDKIEILTQKETTTYVIDQITIVNPTDVSVLAPRSRSSVTLVTCYPFYFIGSAPQRYIVQASLLGPDAEAQPRSEDAEF